MKRVEIWKVLVKLHAMGRKLRKKHAPRDLIEYVEGAARVVAEGEV